ncbi:NUDIX domain-containing protein [Corynebacteriaceae bacterium 7-707]
MIDQETGYYAVPSSVKAVVYAAEGSGTAVLLGLNDRGEWELPGGWPDSQDESLAETLSREVLEETGIVIENDCVLVGAELFSPVPGRQVTLICFATRLDAAKAPVSSLEHKDVRWVEVASLPTNLPAIYRRFIEASVSAV